VLSVSLAGAGTLAGSPALERQFDQTVRPFVAKYCAGCHSGPSAAAQLDLKSFTSVETVRQDYRHWALVMERLKAKEMPPKPVPPPPAAVTNDVIAWIGELRAEEIRNSAGDPGIVPARRLSSAEYNYTIRDLTGRDMQVTREFPVDPANPAGFDNSGESLTMSPALLNKFLRAAREVADHMVLSPDSIDFAPHSMLVETDREKYAIERIVRFYQRQPTDYAEYFRAAWVYRHRAELGKPGATLVSVAAEMNLSPRYLPLVWEILQEPGAIGPVLKLQTMWQVLPAPGADRPDLVKTGCEEMRDFVKRIRAHTAMQFVAPVVKGLPPASQPLLNWKLREFAAHRRDSDPADLRNNTDPPPEVPEIPRYPRLHQESAFRWAALSAKARAGDSDLIVPAAERSRYEAAFARFARVFPDTFYVSERGRYFPDDSEDKGRLLSAGYHNVMGYFRDDTPLMELILDEKGRKELDRLWNEFDYIAHFTERTWTQYFFNQSGEVERGRAESATPRPVDHAVTDEAVILRLRDAYVAKAAADPQNDPVAPQAIREHFEGVNATLRSLESERREAEPKHLQALLRFAARAYRRPLSKAEGADLLAYYRTLRTKNELSHEDAIREWIVGVLMSPDFLYRIDLLEESKSVANRPARAPLSGYALASRLSYFLWSSMPDDELVRCAASGDLEKRDVLLAQARRMLKDERVRGFATEFAGDWLGFRHFETTNSVDRERFPAFNNDLRAAMFEEPVRYIEETIRNDRSVLDLLFGDYTFVNPALERHYGMPAPNADPNSWVRVDGAGRYGRGGLLPMAVFLTQNSPGLRTSPVKRGYWVVQRVLGEVIPPPPAVVPELPSDEAKSELPVPEMLARHRQNAVCAACHARFDSFGLAFEGYGPVGDARTSDLAGRAVHTGATYPGGFQGEGLEGLRTYIRAHREQDFVDNLGRKLLAYALNRSLQLSDESLIESMKAELASNQYRFGSLIETIVGSSQFRYRRVSELHATARSVAESRKAK
jgi:hypothetical protein